MDAIFVSLPTALIILKADPPKFTVDDVNNAFLKLTGMERGDLLQHPFFKAVNKFTSERFQKDLNELSSILETVIEEKKLIETNIFEIEKEDNKAEEMEHIYLQFKCSPVKNSQGSVEYVIMAADNVTDLFTKKGRESSQTQRIKTRKELLNLTDDLESQAASNKAQYESASQELDDFVYSVSHDLRAPLRRIDGFSQELLNEYADKLDETGAHYLNRIRQGAQDMGQLIDDLLKLSRISRKSIEKEEVDLGTLARTVFDELMDFEPKRDVELKIDDSLKVEADKGLIKAMLTNLISNALKFSSNNENTEIHLGSKKVDGEKVFYISDNGVGFDAAYSHKLFKAFSRLHSNSKFSGTGIGLAIVKRIMTLHGGTIWAESPEGEGATFYFKF